MTSIQVSNGRPEVRRAEKRRVAYLCEYSTLLGGERSLLAMLHAARDVIAPIVALPGEGRLMEALESLGISSLETGSLKSDPADLDRAVDKLRPSRPQVIHANSLSMHGPAIEIGRRLKLPVVVHARDIYHLSAKRLLNLGEADRVIAVSPAVKEFWIKEGIAGRRIAMIPNGVAIPSTTTERKRWANTGRDSIPTVACIGQISLRKGQDLWAQAAGRLVKEGRRIRCLLVGERYSGKQESIDFEKRLAEWAEPARLAGCWDVLGYRDDVPTLLTQIDAVVVPSRQEPLSRVILEAFAARCPVVASDVGGNSFLLDGGRAGWLVAPTAEGVAEGIAQSLDDRSTTERKVEAAFRRVAEVFSLDRQVTAMVNEYDQLIGK